MGEESAVEQQDARVSRSGRHAFWLALAVAANLVSLAAFLWLPWAEGRGAFAGRDFTGPELARLVRNTDIVLDNAAGGPLAFLLMVALYAVPVAAVTAACLLTGARWTSNPRGAVRVAVWCSPLIVIVTLAVALGLSFGPAAGDLLERHWGWGSALACAAESIATTAALWTFLRWPKQTPPSR